MMACTKCPATMCPLMAPDGSPWTGDKDAPCPGSHDRCGWWQGFGGTGCDGRVAALSQVDEAAHGEPVLQLGALVEGGRAARRTTQAAPREYDCPKAKECQWQRESAGLCPPRYALSLGLDPRVCAW